MIRILILLFLFACSNITSAQDDGWVHIGMLSKHFSSGHYNESHLLVGAEYNNWYVGHYDNSYYKDSFFVFYNYRYKKVLPKTFIGLKMGGITGYEDLYQIGGITPAIIPTLFVDTTPFGFDINILGSIISIEAKVKF